MSISYQFTHNTDEVFEQITDPDFIVDRSLALGEVSAEAEVEDFGNKVVISMTREVVRDLPKFLAKLFDPKQVLHVKETWQQVGEQYVGSAEFTVEGQPVTVKSSSTLKPTDNGCVYTVKHTAKAKIPLVGGKVEKFIIGNCEEGSEKELAYTDEQLKATASA